MKAIKCNLTTRIQLTNKTKNTMDKTELECNHSNLKYSEYNWTRVPLTSGVLQLN